TTNDPTVTGAGSNTCGAGRNTTDSSFSVTISSGLKPDTTYTITVTADNPPGTDIRDAANNPLSLTANSATFTSGAGDFTPPTLVDARVTNNLGTSDWGFNTAGATEASDAFSMTFSETMSGTASSAATGTIQVQDQDGTVLLLTCGSTVTCLWNSTVTGVTVTVTGTPALAVFGTGVGTTPGMQIPFNITTLNGFNDLQGNVPNVLGSSDRLVDYE
ncbi:MAG: hypothetical protein M3T56_03795, partial [Chloroflexota bacterium]|nr:hypothetical protein [Chloroflexota bacterium]